MSDAIAPEVLEGLAHLADQRDLDAAALDVLAPIFDAIATLQGPDTARVQDLQHRLTAGLGPAAASALCLAATSPAEVSQRYFRLRDLLRTREAIAG